jgi:hypothetical protein
MKFKDLPKDTQELIIASNTPGHEELDYLYVPGHFTLAHVTIKRALGLEWYDRQSNLQRPARVAASEKFTFIMDMGDWTTLPNAVMVWEWEEDEAGARKAVGVNGKTTLKSFTESNLPELSMLVCFGITEKALRALDGGGSPRTPTQNHKMATGESDPRISSHFAMLRFANELQYKNGWRIHPRSVDATVLPYLDRYYSGAVRALSGLRQNHYSNLSRPEWGTLLLLYYVDQEVACRLARQLVTPYDVRHGDASDVYKVVVSNLRGNGGHVGSEGERRLCALIIRTFKAMLHKKELSENALKRGLASTGVRAKVMDQKDHEWLSTELLKVLPLDPLAQAAE